jgi:hypothetical protein
VTNSLSDHCDPANALLRDWRGNTPTIIADKNSDIVANVSRCLHQHHERDVEIRILTIANVTATSVVSDNVRFHYVSSNIVCCASEEIGWTGNILHPSSGIRSIAGTQGMDRITQGE